MVDWQSMSALAWEHQTSLFRYRERIVDLNAEIADRRARAS